MEQSRKALGKVHLTLVNGKKERKKASFIVVLGLEPTLSALWNVLKESVVEEVYPKRSCAN